MLWSEAFECSSRMTFASGKRLWLEKQLRFRRQRKRLDVWLDYLSVMDCLVASDWWTVRTWCVSST